MLKEIESQLDENPDKLIFVSLEPFWTEKGFRVMRGDEVDLKPLMEERNYVNCAGLDYQEQLRKILRALRTDLSPEEGLEKLRSLTPD